jgi:DNA helicase II / ATP-dependent DNA helicase PcrA
LKKRIFHMQFDADQLAVIGADYNQKLLVLAGPGSGKTEVSARRIARLVAYGVGASEMLVLSFSRSAVRTLTERLSKVVGIDDYVLEELRHIAIRTFDSWTFRLLRRLGHAPDKLLANTHDDNIMILVDLIRSGERSQVADLLKNVKHLVVDEMQDLAGIRGDLVVELLNLIAPPCQDSAGFTLLGDTAQSIYAFSVRNSDRTSIHGQTTNELIGTLHKIYGQELRLLSLDINHRATPKLAIFLERLRKILSRDISGEDKFAAMTKVMSELPSAEFELSKELVPEDDQQTIAILARTNGEVLRIAQKILGHQVEGPGVRFQVGSRDTDGAPAWVAALLSYLKSSTLTLAQFNAIYTKAKQQAPECLDKLDVPQMDKAWQQLLLASGRNKTEMSLTVSDLAQRLSWPDSFPEDVGQGLIRLNISTIHQAKGREFDVVAVLDREPEQDQTSIDFQEEANLDFVALSRASKKVVSLSRDSVFSAPKYREFGKGSRKRLFWWRNNWVNMEMGIRGDVVPESFVDLGLHESENVVIANYQFLAANAHELIGHKVMLRKGSLPGSEGMRARYEICLQDGRQPGRLLGAMSQSLVYDLLNILHSHGRGLPKTIMNLRISNVVSIPIISNGENRICPTFSTSQMCLGVELFGMGDFQTFGAKT